MAIKSTPGRMNGLGARIVRISSTTATASAAASLARIVVSAKSPILPKFGLAPATTPIAPMSISQPVAAMKPPMTGKGTKRMARPARNIPRPLSRNPVRPVANTITINVGASRSTSPAASRRCAIVASSAATTAEVEESGPAIVKGSELRQVTIAPATAADMNVTATP